VPTGRLPGDDVVVFTEEVMPLIERRALVV
jgi:hypothetical protein